MEQTKKDLSSTLYYLTVVISFCFLSIMLYQCFNNSVWCDEVFSIYMVRGSYIDILVNTATDVHPPLYYFILKFFFDPMTGIFPYINVVVLSKIISFASMVAIFYFCVFKLSKELPKIVVGLFMLSIFALSAINDFALTIRMYGWATFFILVAVYFFIKIIRYNRSSDYKKFVLFFELASLMHNFAFITMVGMFFVMIVYSLIFNRKNFWTVYKYALFALLIYTPWLVVIACQFAYIKAMGYWIGEQGAFNIKEILEFVFCPSYLNMSETANLVVTIILIAIYVGLFLWMCLCKRIDKKEKMIAFIGAGTTLFLLGCGIGVSLLITPIFVSRYSIFILMPFYLSVLYTSYLLLKNYLLLPVSKDVYTSPAIVGKAFFILSALFIASFAILNIANVVRQENRNVANYNNLSYTLQKYNGNLICDAGNVQSVLEFSYGLETLSLKGSDSSWWENVTHVTHTKIGEDEIVQKLQNGESCYLFNLNAPVEFEKLGVVPVEQFELETGLIVTVYIFTLVG